MSPSLQVILIILYVVIIGQMISLGYWRWTRSPFLFAYLIVALIATVIYHPAPHLAFHSAAAEHWWWASWLKTESLLIVLRFAVVIDALRLCARFLPAHGLRPVVLVGLGTTALSVVVIRDLDPGLSKLRAIYATQTFLLVGLFVFCLTSIGCFVRFRKLARCVPFRVKSYYAIVTALMGCYAASFALYWQLDPINGGGQWRWITNALTAIVAGAITLIIVHNQFYKHQDDGQQYPLSRP